MIKEIQGAIFQALSNDETLIRKVKSITDYLPGEEEQEFPFLVIGDLQFTPRNTFGSRGKEGSIALQVFSKYDGKLELMEIEAEIERILETVSVPALGFFNLEVEDELFSEDEKDQTFQLDLRCRVAGEG
ncbi:hypothetical protein SANA_22890 [Gottschalkiaceae bacterium SANA]|nr:hypothetical protein SANA_22890 [Gottschalkiaceae bacterium SANA]